MTTNQLQVPQTPDTTDLVPLLPASPLKEIYQRGVEYLRVHPEQVIPQGRAPWANNDALYGEPFIVVSAWIYRTAKSEYDAEGWKQVQLYICPVDMENWQVGEPQLATFHGKAVLNQFRSLLPNDVIGMGVFTIGRHRYKVGQQPAWVFRYYQHGVDNTIVTEGKDAILVPGGSVFPVPPSPFDADADRQTVETLKRGHEEQKVARAKNGTDLTVQRTRDELWIKIDELMEEYHITDQQVKSAAGWDTLMDKPPDAVLWTVQQLIKEKALASTQSGQDVQEATGTLKKTRH